MGLDGWMVIIGQRSSKSTFSANNHRITKKDFLWFSVPLYQIFVICFEIMIRFRESFREQFDFLENFKCKRRTVRNVILSLHLLRDNLVEKMVRKISHKADIWYFFMGIGVNKTEKHLTYNRTRKEMLRRNWSASLLFYFGFATLSWQWIFYDIWRW